MDEFERFSRDIGLRLDLVQGAGGNTSIKLGSVLRVKASGFWLSQALDRRIFVDADLERLRAALDGDFDDRSLTALFAGEQNAGLRPSIETPLHALSPYRVVAHVHSVNAIAWAVRRDAQSLLAGRLAGLDWAFIPYRRPGAPLAAAVKELYATSRPQVLILGNHGLVVSADSVDELRALLDDVERRLATPAAKPDESEGASRPPAPQNYRWADDSAASYLARDAARLRIASRGSLYPDHVVFLGSALTVLDRVEALDDLSVPPKVAVASEAGVLARNDLTPGAVAMLDCLGLVLARIDPSAPINYLSAGDERALLGWDAEAHRQALDQRGGTGPGR